MNLGGSSFALRCLHCDAIYLPDQVSYYCPSCELDGALDLVYDYAELSRGFVQGVQSSDYFDMWRYTSVLPTSLEFTPHLHTGGSPLYKLKHSGPGRVFIKDDSRNPSGSLKDRASALAVALAAEMGVKTIAAASTGNAAAALACMSAGSGIRCVIFAPTSAAREKLAQIRAYGAEVVEVEGGYDEAFAACHAACKEHGWYNRSTGINSYMSEGKKTVAFEICEQMQWRVPDRIFVPVGNGCIVGAVYKGFHELMLMGITERMPKIMGVQASGSDFMYRAWKAGDGPHAPQALPSATSASSISVALPRDRIKALRAVEASGGEYVVVNDAQIFQAILDLARSGGVFAEPGAAAAYAGLRQWGALQPDETAVVLVTGSGLKDIGGLLGSGVLDAAKSPLRQHA
ncbi:threonine synthase [Albitalea terrae]|uniref:Threonine synthase n=1 Tax=Piscinibacter terrae TaxID=2496871 RepID=A0A3N7HL80_9BURK|nr:threonine synthase [Albitalea terrae]